MRPCSAAGTAGCPELSGFTVEPDADHTGWGDMSTSSSAADAAAACRAHSGCQGFNSGGVLKAYVAPSSPQAGVCLYTKMPALTSECRLALGGWERRRSLCAVHHRSRAWV